MQTGWAPDDEGSLAGVWDEQTGMLVWAPRAVAICWLRGGREVAVATEQYATEFERWSWPERERLSSCEVAHREGWADFVTVSPTDELAVVRWIDQTEAGFELVEIHPDGDRQLKRKGYRTGESNLIEGPVFSPSGRFLALSEGHMHGGGGTTSARSLRPAGASSPAASPSSRRARSRRGIVRSKSKYPTGGFRRTSTKTSTSSGSHDSSARGRSWSRFRRARSGGSARRGRGTADRAAVRAGTARGG